MGVLGFSVLTAQVSALPIVQSAHKQPASPKAAHADPACLAAVPSAPFCAQTSGSPTAASSQALSRQAFSASHAVAAVSSVPNVANVALVSQVTTRASMSSTSNGASGSVPAMIRQTFGAYASSALAVASCESGYNPSARNSYSGAAGVFQFLPSTWSGTSYAGYSMYNAWANIQAAHQVFVRDGYSWSEWSCKG
jgi:hypothetical protein